MSVDIRQYTRVIIRKNRGYLKHREMFTGALVWDSSPYMAWWTRSAVLGRMVAKKTGGTAMLFNPAIGKVKVL